MEIRVVASDEQYEKLRAALGAGAIRSFDMRWSHDAEFDPQMLLSRAIAPEVALRCWIDLRDPRRARLYFARGLTERYLVRALSLSGAFNEMDREALAQIIELSLRALNEDSSYGMSREEVRSMLQTEQRKELTAPPAPPRPRAPAEPPRRVALRPGAYYFIGAHSLQVPITHGPGVLLGLWSTRGRQRAGVVASVRYELTQDYSDSRIALSFDTVAARVEAELLGAIDPRGEQGRTFLGVRVGLGQDLVMLRPRPARSDPGYDPVDPKLAPAWVASGSLVGTVRWGGGTSVFAALGVQADPAQVHYDLDAGSANEMVIERLRVRPASVLGVTAW